MTKEEVLQKVNDYCTEKQYTTATLTDAFKDKFADHFQKADPEGDVSDEAILNSLKFALNTAFSSASELATVKATEFQTKENDYKAQIAELNKKIGKPAATPTVEIPDEIKSQLEELKEFKTAQSKQEKFKAIIALAKKNIQPDLHTSFEKFAQDYEVKLDADTKEQADTLVSRYQDIMAPSYGNIRPLAPQATKQRDEEFLQSMKKVKVTS